MTMVKFRKDSEPMTVVQVNIGIVCKEQLWAGSYNHELPITMWPVAMLELVMDDSFQQQGVWVNIDEREENMNVTDRSWGEDASPAD